MKKIILIVLVIALLISCNKSKSKTVEKEDRIELIPEPDKEIREEYVKQQEFITSKCFLTEPDTSVVGIKIRNAESTLHILGKKVKLEGDSTHVFYSNDKKQLLGLTVHPGDFYNQVSIFKISYSIDSKQNYRQINAKVFETEKGITLGISKWKLTEKLGTCYIAKDSTKNSIELNFHLTLPNDSSSKLLYRNHIPSYYAIYKLKNDKVESIEFGFEYP